MVFYYLCSIKNGEKAKKMGSAQILPLSKKNGRVQCEAEIHYSAILCKITPNQRWIRQLPIFLNKALKIQTFFGSRRIATVGVSGLARMDALIIIIRRWICTVFRRNFFSSEIYTVFSASVEIDVASKCRMLACVQPNVRPL